jgi:hypothetical protein
VTIPNKLVIIDTVKVMDNTSVLFEIQNIGKNDFIIDTVIVDCFCAKILWPKTKLKKSDNTFIEVTFIKNNHGPFQHNIYVYGNTKDSPIMLTLQGDVYD